MDRLSPLDASFFHLERDVQQLHIGSALLFEGPAPTYGELCRVIDAKLAQVPRYRQHVRRVPLELGRPVWADDTQFDVRRHVRRISLRRPGTERQLRSLAARLMSEHLDLSRPLWEMWLVRNVADGDWAVINKAHHAMIDGISGTDIMEALLDHEPQPSPVAVPSWTPRPEPSTSGLVTAALVEALRSPVELARVTAHGLLAPRRLAVQTLGLAQAGARVARPENVLDGPIGPRRRWGWARADLGDAKKVKNEFGGTVNDVVLAAVTGALRTFLLSRGETVDGRTIRSLVPVSTRHPGDHGATGNQVSAVFADLPVGVADPAARLALITRQLGQLKHGGMAVGVDAMMAATGYLPLTLFALSARAVAHFPQRAISTVTRTCRARSSRCTCWAAG